MNPAAPRLAAETSRSCPTPPRRRGPVAPPHDARGRFVAAPVAGDPDNLLNFMRIFRPRYPDSDQVRIRNPRRVILSPGREFGSAFLKEPQRRPAHWTGLAGSLFTPLFLAGASTHQAPRRRARKLECLGALHVEGPEYAGVDVQGFARHRRIIEVGRVHELIGGILEQ